MRRKFVAILPAILAAASYFGVAAAQELTTVRFVLDWKFEGQQAQFTAPVEDGTFKKMGLNVLIDRGQGSADTVAKVASGAYDMGHADTYAMIRFNAANPNTPLISVAIVQDASAVGIVALRSKGIATPQDLIGKKLYSPAAEVGRQLFPIFALQNKIDGSQIQWNTVSPDLRDAMLARKEADAVTSNTVTTIMNLGAVGIPESELQVFHYAKYGVPLYGTSLVTTRAFAEKNPEVVRNVIRGVAHGLNVMISDPDKAMASVKKRDPLLNDEVEKRRMNRTMRDSLITENVLKNGFSSVDKARLETTLKQTSPAFNIPVPALDAVYTDKYLPPRADLKILPWKWQ